MEFEKILTLALENLKENSVYQTAVCLVFLLRDMIITKMAQAV